MAQPDFFQEIRLFQGRWQGLEAAILGCLLLSLPLLLPTYELYVVNTILVFVLVALGLNILIGFAGQISLGHAGFVAIGAYSCVLLADRWGLPFLLALPMAGLIAACFGFLLGLPALRLKGPYLAIASLGFGLTVTQSIGRWSFFGGHMGLQVLPAHMFGWEAKGDVRVYVLILPITLLLVLYAFNLTKTRIGRALLAIRDSEAGAAALGIDVAQTKLLAFALSAFYAGIAGGLWSQVLGYLNAETFDYFLSILFLAMVVVGGLGHHWGAILGAVLVTFLNLKLQNVVDLPLLGPALDTFSTAFMSKQGVFYVRYVFFGLVFLGVVLFEPRGLYGLFVRARMRLRGQ